MHAHSMTRIAIIGAGMAGLATAYGLRTLPVDVTVFEKSRGYGGRVATRGRQGARYDHGANYFTAPTPRLRRLITAHLPTDGLLQISRSIWSFEADGTLCRPDPDEEGEERWTYRQGINRLGKLLAQQSGATVRTETPIQRVFYRENTWTCESSTSSYSDFDALVLTPPAPQTAEILSASRVGAETLRRMQQGLNAVSYTSQFSFVFGYDRVLSRPGPFYGLRSADGEHPIQWIGFEHEKPGHVRSGHSVLVVQTAPGWTAERLEQEPVEFVHEVKEYVEDILISDLRHPAWYDAQKWRYARPRSAMTGDMGTERAEYGLFLAGDYVAGVGRVAAALESGIQAAEEIRDWYDDA